MFNSKEEVQMKKFLITLLLVVMVIGVHSYLQAQSYTFPKQGTQNQKIGFGSVVTADSDGSLAISSCDGMTKVDDCSHSAQLGTGTQANDALGRQSLGGDESLKYRGTVVTEADNVLGVRAWGNMKLQYATWMDEFNMAGYVAGAATTNVPGAAIPGSKFSETAYRGGFLVTVVDGGGDDGETIHVDDNVNSLLEIVSNDASNDTVQVQLNGEPFQVIDGKELWFNSRFAVTDVTNSEFAVGLTLRGATDMLGTPGNDCIYYRVANGGLLSYHVIQNGTETTASTGVTLLDASLHSAGFYWDGNDTLTFSVDGTIVATVTDNGTTILIPDDETMTAFAAIEAWDEAAAKTCQIDYMGVVNTR